MWVWIDKLGFPQLANLLDKCVPSEVDLEAKHVPVDVRATAAESVIGDTQSDVVVHVVVQRETRRQQIDLPGYLGAVDLRQHPLPIDKVIFEEVPDFESIIKTLNQLEDQINEPS